ncbi:MAG: hypothetical protein QXJ75_02100 [Candidatus Bathyarchaeia archaeon]
MSGEVGLKREGEDLAKLAVSCNIGAKQLRTLYDTARTRDKPMLEAYVQYQIPRISGYLEFGEKMLQLIGRYEKMQVVTILQYANMLYDYYRLKRWKALEPIIGETIKRTTQQYGYIGVEIRMERDTPEVFVMLRDFRGNPRQLAEELSARIKQNITEIRNIPVKIWIRTQVERR